MKFQYRKEPNFSDPTSPWLLKPVIEVQLASSQQKVQVAALLDSGADCSLFHASLAQVLGINLQEGRREQFFGIADVGIAVYFHPIQLRIIGEEKAIEIEAGFAASSRVVAILGQSDFFQHYKVTFERYKERIEIAPAKK